MSRCYPGALFQNVRKKSLSSEENWASATRGGQEEMDQIVSPTSHGKGSMGNQAKSRNHKRKKLQALELSTSDTASLNNKRRRENVQPSNSSPLGAGSRGMSHNKKEGSSGVVDTGERRISLQSSGLSRFVSPRSPSTKGKDVINGGNGFSGAHEATSAYGSGLANQSTVTTSSNEEEEDSTSLHSFGQTLKVARGTVDTVNLIRSIQAVGIGSTGSRRTSTHDNHKRKAKRVLVNYTQRERRNSSIFGHQRDGEVLSPFSNIFTNLTAHDVEVDRVSGSTLRDAIYGERSGKTETTCVVNSGCTSIETGRPERARRATDYGSSIRQRDDSSELVHSSCSRELQSSSIDPDLCLSSCSESIPSRLVTPYKLYRPMEPSRMKGLVVSLSQRNSSTVDEILAASGTFATDEYKGKNSEVTPESSDAASSSASEQETENSSYPATECKSSGGEAHPHVDGGQNPAPTFVLSSGRMSKQEAKRFGVRPPTIDDDFDQYFAQLML